MRWTLGDLQGKFEQIYAHPPYKQATWIRMAKALDQITKYFTKDRDPNDIFRTDVYEFETFLVNNGVPSNSIERILAAGATFYNWMQVQEVVPIGYNPFARLKTERFTKVI